MLPKRFFSFILLLTGVCISLSWHSTSTYRSRTSARHIDSIATKFPLFSTLTNIDVLTRNDQVKFLTKSVAMPKVYVSDTVAVAVQEMNKNDRGGILILDENDALAGIFTERDFVTKILDAQLQSSMISVSSVMTPVSKLLTTTENKTLFDCRQMMVQRNVRHLPIIDEINGKPVGLVSMRDIIRALQEEDLARGSAAFAGNTLDQIEEQAIDRANALALESGSGKQDFLRAGFVITAVLSGAFALLSGYGQNHEYATMAATFLLGYIGIVFENNFEFNKAGIALIMSAALWVILDGCNAVAGIPIAQSLSQLSEKVSEVSEVIFFILGAMTIVEIVDAHAGFKVVTDKIEAKNKRSLMWVVGMLTFFMSAILDNLTTTIVMVSLVKKLLPAIDDRKLFGAMIVIAANAGGAWTPIGDVTTTMLWINGQISAMPTIVNLFLPSLVSVIVSILALEKYIPAEEPVPEKLEKTSKLAPRGQLVFGTGLAGLLSVPVFKALTGLPPYLGMLAALGVMWTLTDAIHAGEEQRKELMAPAALKKIDTSGVLFFLGILLSVGALDSAGLLRSLAEFLDSSIPSQSLLAPLIGFASALIDNVPLVAATMGMYSLDKIAPDSSLWQLIAFCAGTGGSLLVIGSASGVALMGLEKVDFMWYAKKITVPALLGYLAGIGVYFGQQQLVGGGSLMSLVETASAQLQSLPGIIS